MPKNKTVNEHTSNQSYAFFAAVWYFNSSGTWNQVPGISFFLCFEGGRCINYNMYGNPRRNYLQTSITLENYHSRTNTTLDLRIKCTWIAPLWKIRKSHLPTLLNLQKFSFGRTSTEVLRMAKTSLFLQSASFIGLSA